MTQSSGNSQAPVPSDGGPARPGRAWYASPLVWSLLILLALLLYGGWLFYLQQKARAEAETAKTAELLTQTDRNARLQAEIDRLKGMTDAEPCTVKTFLTSQPKTDNPVTPATPPATTPSTLPSTLPSTTPAGAPPATAPPTTPAKPEAAQLPKTVAALLEQATVLILSSGQEDASMGTGFFIAPGIILTNRHVVGDSKNTIVVLGKFTDVAARAEVLAISPEEDRDYAVLKVPVTSVTPLSLSTSVARTQKVSAWGFPGAVTGDDPKFQALLSGKSVEMPEVVYSEGAVSVVLERKPPLIVHTAVVSQGNSGGPLVNDKGEVVGINTYIRLDDESYRQSSLAIVSRDLADFLTERKIPFTLAPVVKE